MGEALRTTPKGKRALAEELQRGTADAALDALAVQAMEAAQTTLGLVTLIGDRLQVFAGASGLPPDLEHSRATDASASCCQFVVASGKELEVRNLCHAAGDQSLVRLYGVESYFGTPVVVQGSVVGATCVLDHVPREFTQEQKAQVRAIAAQASERLESRLRTIEVANASSLARAQDNQPALCRELTQVERIFFVLEEQLRAVGLRDDASDAAVLFEQALRLEPMRRHLVWALDRVSETLVQAWALGRHNRNAAWEHEAGALNAFAGDAKALFRLFFACLDAKISAAELHRNIQVLTSLTGEISQVRLRFAAFVAQVTQLSPGRA